ncbi:MAG: MFS transporter [Geminicoccaceae bacterium]|nr:MFS transporter [Geminicoccaceae bacterium]
MTQAGAALPECQGRGAAPGGAVHRCPEKDRPFVLVVAILASSLGFIDGSVVSVAIPAIRASLGAGFVEVQWVANAYMLLLSSLILVGGAAGDRFGQRDVFAAGIGLFVAASLACAFAGSAPGLIACRALQGVGAAFMVPGSLALIAKNIPRAERGRAVGVWAAAAGVSSALGPLVGGWVLASLGDGAWRWIFAINLPSGLVTLALLFRRVPRDRPSLRAKLDWQGALLATAGLGLVAYALTAAGEGEEPDWPLIAAAAAAGAATLAGFLAWERCAEAPMMPLDLFASKAFSGANLLTFLLYTALAGVLFYLPMTLIQARGYSAAWAGGVFLPFTLVMASLARFAGGLADRAGLRLPLTLGPLITGAAFLLLAPAVASGAFWSAIVPAMALLGVGMGLAVSPLSTAVVLAADDARAGAASGINNAVARTASLFAVAGLGAVAAAVFAAAAKDPALVGQGFGAPLDGLDAGARAARDLAMIRGFQAVAATTAALAALSAAVAWLTQPGAARGRSGLEGD